MSDYGKARVGLKSPSAIHSQEIKNYKKKYEQSKEAIKLEKKHRELLEEELKESKMIIERQNKDLNKKEELI